MPGPNPTNFANWSRYFSANQGGAEAEAEKMAVKQRKAAQAAQKSTAGLVTQFAGKAGLPENPAPGAYSTISGPGSTNVGNYATAPQPMQAAAPVAPAAPALTPEQQLAQAEAGAKASYTGPAELAELGGHDAAYAQNLAAQQGLNQLGSTGGIEALGRESNPGLTSGESRFGAALTGTAGRGKFDRLRGEFSLQKDWEAAEQKAKALGAQGTDRAKIAAADWQAKAKELKAQAADAQLIGESKAKAMTEGQAYADAAKKKMYSAMPKTASYVRDGEYDYEKFAGGTSNGLQSGADWFHRNMPKALWNKLSDDDLGSLTNAIRAAQGERNGEVDAQITALRKKYGQ